MLVDVKRKKRRHHAAQRQRAVIVAQLHRLYVANQPRIIDSFHRVKFHHCRLVVLRHVTPSPRTGASRFAISGSLTLLAGRGRSHAWSALSAFLLSVLPE